MVPFSTKQERRSARSLPHGQGSLMARGKFSSTEALIVQRRSDPRNSRYPSVVEANSLPSVLECADMSALSKRRHVAALQTIAFDLTFFADRSAIRFTKTDPLLTSALAHAVDNSGRY